MNYWTCCSCKISHSCEQHDKACSCGLLTPLQALQCCMQLQSGTTAQGDKSSQLLTTTKLCSRWIGQCLVWPARPVLQWHDCVQVGKGAPLIRDSWGHAVLCEGPLPEDI